MESTVKVRAWERAYEAFETPEQEVHKFTRRLRHFCVDEWPKDSKIVELFCGRGNGLVALERLGFRNLAGVDLSSALLARYGGRGQVHAADCRALPFPASSQDIVLVQGGLHHLASLETDLPAVLSEIFRVLRPGGKFLIVEPWLSPFLKLAHGATRTRFLTHLSTRLRALATMIELETPTYQTWLAQPGPILATLEKYFTIRSRKTEWGKLFLTGAKGHPPEGLALPGEGGL